MSKVICVRLPDGDIWAEFMSYVAKKYQKTKGVLGLEVCKALETYLEVMREKEHAHTNKNMAAGDASVKEKSKSRTMKTLSSIAERVVADYPNEVPQTEVERIITEVAGGDKRTLTKYANLLIEHDILRIDRPIQGTKPTKYIFKVNKDANIFG